MICRPSLDQAVADALQEVRLAEADRAVEEERVVQRAGRIGDALGRREGQPVARPDDEVVEDVAGVQPGARVGWPPAVGRARPLQQRRIVRRRAQRLERDVDRAIGEVRERAQHQGPEALLQPFRDELGARADDQHGAVEADSLGIGEPGLVVGLGNVLPEVAERGLPELGRVLLHPCTLPALAPPAGALPASRQPTPGIDINDQYTRVGNTRTPPDTRFCPLRARRSLAPAIRSEGAAQRCRCPWQTGG